MKPTSHNLLGGLFLLSTRAFACVRPDVPEQLVETRTGTVGVFGSLNLREGVVSGMVITVSPKYPFTRPLRLRRRPPESKSRSPKDVED